MTSKRIVLDEEATDDNYGTVPEKRTSSQALQFGLISLDKPRGPTSHEVVAWVRKMTGVERAGHSGTLDPPVSGLLPIGTGDATKALSLLLLYPKEYRGVMRLHSSVPRKLIEGVVTEFTGEIFQRPPQRSSVVRQTRTRNIYEFEISESQGNLLLFRVLCQSGTYIRKLVYDMGEIVGVGATMIELRRTRVGPLTESQGFVTLHQLNDALFRAKAEDEVPLLKLVRPIEDVLRDVKTIVVRDSAIDAICHGARLGLPGVLSASDPISKAETVAILSQKGELVAIGKSLMTSQEMLKLHRGLASTTDRVIMRSGTYPRLWKRHAAQISKDAHTGQIAA